MKLVDILRVVSAYETVEISRDYNTIVKGSRREVLHFILNSEYKDVDAKSLFVNVDKTSFHCFPSCAPSRTS